MKSLLRVLGYLKPYKKTVTLTLSFAVVTTLLDLVPPWLIKIIVDQLIDEQAENIRSLAEMINASICYQVEPSYSQEQYDIVISMVDESQAK